MQKRYGLFLCFSWLLTGCLIVPQTTPAVKLPDQRWADSTAQQVAVRMERLLGHRFQTFPTIQMLTVDSAAHVLDSFPMRVRKDTVIRKLWADIGLYQERDQEKIAAGRMRKIATRAMYLPKSHRVLLVPGYSEEALEKALAHEMVHAMQSERYALAKQMRAIDNEDGMVGYLAAAEGQAEVLGGLLEATPTQPTVCNLGEGPLWLLADAIHVIPQYRSLPAALVMPSYAPYVFGTCLASQVFHTDGLRGVDSLMLRVPQGSWALWNPQLYLQGERLVDWDTAWTGLRLPNQWAPVGHGRIGAIRLAALFLEWDRALARQLLSKNHIDWRGDRLWSARNAEGEHAFVWALQFRSIASAKSFARAWWRVRAQQKNQLPTLLTEGEFISTGLVRDTPLRVQRLEQDRERVWIADGFPEELSARLLQNVRRIPVRER